MKAKMADDVACIERFWVVASKPEESPVDGRPVLRVLRGPYYDYVESLDEAVRYKGRSVRQLMEVK